MPASRLDSQLATMEDPGGEAGVVSVDIAAPLEAIVAASLERLSPQWRQQAWRGRASLAKHKRAGKAAPAIV